MIVNCHRQHAFGPLLPYHILIKDFGDFTWSGQAPFRAFRSFLDLFANNVSAQFDTFITDKDGRPGD